jgi:hypothetical protein
MTPSNRFWIADKLQANAGEQAKFRGNETVSATLSVSLVLCVANPIVI